LARGRRAPRRIEQDLIEQDLAATPPPIPFPFLFYRVVVAGAAEPRPSH